MIGWFSLNVPSGLTLYWCVFRLFFFFRLSRFGSFFSLFFSKEKKKLTFYLVGTKKKKKTRCRFTNNLLSTAQSMYLKATLATPAGAVAPMGSTTYVKEQVIDVETEDARPTGE